MSSARVQREHAPAVLASQLQLEQRWGRPCCAYLVCARPGRAAAAALAAVQDRVLALEPSLLRVPRHALHASLAWLLPAHQEFGLPKDELWRRRGPDWAATAAQAAAAAPRFRLRLRGLAATSAAIIAVADEPNPFSALRRDLVPRLRVPGESSSGGLAHITLFRYAAPLRDPAALLRLLASPGLAAETGLPAETGVSELLIIAERVFPALDTEVLHRLPLAPAGPAPEQPAAGPAR